MRKTITTSIFLLLCTTVMAQTMGTMTDRRDGQTYKTVSYEVSIPGKPSYRMTWLAENMDYDRPQSYEFEEWTTGARESTPRCSWSCEDRAARSSM